MKKLTGKLATLAALLALAPATLNGQGGSTSGSISVGYRGFTEQPTAAQEAGFLKYRDIPKGVFLQSVNLLWNSMDNGTFMFLQGNELGENDQAVRLNIGRPGSFRFDASWGRLPHIYTTTARLPGTESQRGFFALPTPRPDTNSLKALPFSEVSQQWQPLRLAAAIAPRNDLDFEIEYQRVDKSGGRALGTPFYFTNHREIPEPIEHTTHALRVSQSIARPQFRLQVAYDLSIFENELAAVVVDNPLVTADAANSPSKGRTALAPDNKAHTFSAVGGVNLPQKTRFNVAANYSLRSQDQEFLPYTINSALNTATLGPLPANLDGDIRTTMLNASISTRAIQNVTVTGRYRYFDYDDQTPELHLNGRVVMDRSVSVTPLEREHFPFSRKNAGVDLSWRAAQAAQVQVAYGWEGWTRGAHRNVASSSENTLRGAVRLMPFDALMLRPSVVQSKRRADEYVQVNSIQNPLHRRFDQADRDRIRFELMAELEAAANITLSGTVSIGNDEFPDAEFGVQSDKARAYGADVTWAPLANLSLSGGYMMETFKNRFISRYRSPTQLSNPTFDWVSNNDDEITTWYLGAETSIDKFDIGGNIQRSEAWLDMLTANPATPAGGTASENNSAKAVDYPRSEQHMMPITAYIRYTPQPKWTVGLGFTYEDFKDQNWRNDNMGPNDGVNWMLGSDLLDYKASFLSMTITYRPQLRRGAAAL